MVRIFQWPRLPWFGLLCILAVFTYSIIALHPTNFFGLSEDDSIYFSSAKALSEGRGYILPSVPGTPPATKYPILYPWILSFVWRCNPSFPANLSGAIAISVTFGLVYLALTFVFLRHLKAFGTPEVLVLTAFCALHPLVLFYSASVLSDIPFAALGLSAMVLADRAMQPSGNLASAVFSGLLAGLSVMVRLFGFPIVLGIGFTALVRRTWRQLSAFAVGTAPFLLDAGWRMVFPPSSISPASGAAATSPGWTHTWAYYTSYLTMWRISVPNGQVFWKMIENNAVAIFSASADFFLAPMFISDTVAGHALVAIVAFATIAGIVRQGTARGWTPVHYSLLPYSAVILFWNFADANNRYFLPFWPLFAAGFWNELKHIMAMARSPLFSAGCSIQKILAAALGVGAFALALGILVNYGTGTRKLMKEKSEERATLLRDKRGAYDWLSRFASPEAMVIAYDDPSVYLYTGRTAIRPIAFSTDQLFVPEGPRIAAQHITDVPRAIGAQYWLIADDDFENEWPEMAISARKFMSTIQATMPIVYASPDGRVLLYLISR